MAETILEDIHGNPLVTLYAGPDRLRVGDERRRIQINGDGENGELWYITLPLGLAQSIARSILTHEKTRP